MKKTSQKKFNRLTKLQELKKALVKEYEKSDAELLQKYNISDDHFDYNYEKWTKDDQNFADAHEELYAEHEHAQRVIDAKIAARFLIATNIARKGKLLHPDTAIRKLKKYGAKGQYVIDMIKTPVLQMVFNSEPYLARELYTSFHVTLMDRRMFDCCSKEIRHRMYFFFDEYGGKHEKKQLHRYQNFIKKFHKSVIEYQNTLSREPF